MFEKVALSLAILITIVLIISLASMVIFKVKNEKYEIAIGYLVMLILLSTAFIGAKERIFEVFKSKHSIEVKSE